MNIDMSVQKPRPRTLITAFLLACCSVFALPAQAATVLVNTTDDVVQNGDNLCSLREAIGALTTGADANDCSNFASAEGYGTNDIIDMTGACGYLALQSGEIGITKPVTINGPGASSLIIGGRGSSRIFKISAATTLKGMTLIDGAAPYDFTTGANQGGAIYAASPLQLIGTTITRSKASSDNGNASGGGIYAKDSIAIAGSTIYGNSSSSTASSTSASGGGLFAQVSGTTLTNSTVTGNKAEASTASGGGLSVDAVTLTNSTIAGNTVSGSVRSGANIQNSSSTRLKATIVANPTGAANCSSSVSSSSDFSLDGDDSCSLPRGVNNQSSIDPKLAALADNGGPTRTMALQSGSPAIDTGGDCSGAPVNGLDQRGVVRDTLCDIGAYEFPAAAGVCGSANGQPSASQPASQLCNAGTASTVTGSSGTWSWNCAGTSTAANCSAPYASQTITASANPTSILINDTSTITASSTSGLLPDLSAITSACTLGTTSAAAGSVQATATGVSAGTCTVKASQAGTGDSGSSRYLAAEKNVDVAVSKRSQKITFGMPFPVVVMDESDTVSATSSSGLTVTFSGPMAGDCGVQGISVTGLTAGTSNCTITAHQAGNDTYEAAPDATLTISVGKGAQAITNFTAPSNLSTGGGSGTLSATASSKTSNAVVFGTSTPSVCSVSGSSVTGIAAGTCTVTADQAGNSNYNAAPQLSRDISIAATVNGACGSGNGVASATAPTALCAAGAASTVTGQNGAWGWSCTGSNAGSTVSCSASYAEQTITGLSAAPNPLNVGDSATLSVTASGASNNPLTYSSSDSSICAVNANQAAGQKQGSCTITANQAGTGDTGSSRYLAATPATVGLTITKRSQSITFDTPSPMVLVDDSDTVRATASSGLTVTFSGPMAGDCGVQSISVTGLTAGTNNCTITAHQAGNDTYEAAPDATLTISIGKGAQAITNFMAPSNLSTGGGSGTLSATASSKTSNAVVFGTSTPSVCSVSGSSVTGLVAGTCTVTADQAGNSNYNAAPQLSRDIAIAVTINGACGSGNGVASAAAPTALCSAGAASAVNGQNGAWGWSCTGSNAGSTASCSASYAEQTITGLSAAPNPLNVGDSATLSVTTSGASNNPLIYSSSDSSICAVNANQAAGQKPGSCTITANQAGTGDSGTSRYLAAAPATVGLTVTKRSQSITFDTPSPVVVVDDSDTVSATASSGLTVTFSGPIAGDCGVQGISVTGLKAGTSNCTITAHQAGNDTYEAAPDATLTISIGKGAQAITNFTAPSNLSTGGGSGTLSATASSKTSNAVIFGTTTPTVCSVSGSNVTGLTAGTCTLTADQAGNSNYNAAPQLSRDIAIAVTVNGACGSGNGVASATAPTVLCSAGAASAVTGQNGAWGWSCTGSNSGSTASCSASYAEQTITGLSAAPNPLNVGDSATLSVTASGASNNPLTYGSSDSNTCAVNGATVAGQKQGSCTLTANQAGTGDTGTSRYLAAAAASVGLTVTKRSQSISFGPKPVVVVDGNDTVSATSSSGLTVTFSAPTGGDCGVQIDQVTGLAAGTNNCTISAHQAGNDTYEAAPDATLTISIGKGAQAITNFTAPSNLSTGGGSGTLSATASSKTSNAVVFGTSTPSVCSVSGSSVTGLAAGTCTVTADQAGSKNYQAAPQLSRDISIAATVNGACGSGNGVASATAPTALCAAGAASTVNGQNGAWGWSCIGSNSGSTASCSASYAEQTITGLSAAPNPLNVGDSATLSVTTSGASNNPLTYNSSDSSICVVNGATVAGRKPGSCTLTANQAGTGDAGNNRYLAAAPATVGLTVTKRSQSISFGPKPVVVVDGNDTVSATSSSGLTVTFSAPTGSDCGVQINQVTGLAAGTDNCTITARQSGDDTYEAAPDATLTLSIGKGAQAISNFTAPSNLSTGGGSGTLSATASAKTGNPVVFGSSTPGVCSVRGNSVTGLVAGTCTVTADQAGSKNYQAAPQLSRDISIAATINGACGSGNGVASAAAPTALCSAGAASAVTGQNDAWGWSCIGSNAGSTASCSASYAEQTITGLSAAPNPLNVGDSATLSVTASGASNNPLTYSSSDSNTCVVNGATVAGQKQGSCTLTANQAGTGDTGNNRYLAAAPATVGLTVTKRSQSISFGPKPVVVVDENDTVSATSSSGLTVTFSGPMAGDCGVQGISVTGLTAGTSNCTITAHQAGNDTYEAAPDATLIISIGKGAQAITNFTAPSNLSTGGGSGTLSATASSKTGNPVVFGTSTPSVCSVSGSSVTGKAAGTCTVTADQAGNSNYNAAPQLSRDIAIAVIINGACGSGNGVASATAPTALCAAGATSTVTGQNGAWGWSCTGSNAGSTASCSASYAEQTITGLSAAPNPLNVGDSATLSVTASGASNNSLTYSSSDSSICAVNANQAAGQKQGSCTITANQAGTGDTGTSRYLAATPASVGLTVQSTTPEAPSTLNATAGNQAVSITFTPGRNGGDAISNYQYSLDGGNRFTAFTPALTGSPVTIHGLVNGTRYAISLRAVNANGPGTASPAVDVTPSAGPTPPPGQVPTAPTKLFATAGDGQATISFTAPSSSGTTPIVNYEFSTDDGLTFTPLTPAANSSPVVVKGLANGTSYRLVLRAVNSGDRGDSSAAVTVLPMAGDSDDDGINVLTEDSVPSSSGNGTGDGNNDGIPDSSQPNVASLPTGMGAAFQTLTSASGNRLSKVVAVAVPDDFPADANAVFAGLTFTASGFAVTSPGSTQMFELHFPASANITGLLKKNRRTGQWVNVAKTVALVGVKTMLSFELQDGGDYDSDALVNGSITDPVFPIATAVPPVTPTPVPTPTPAPRPAPRFGAGGSMNLLLLLPLMLVAWRRRKQWPVR